MKDRVPTYPGRVRLTPLGGNLYDLAMADEPSQVGTPLNKATLLTDATASLLGLSGDPTVDNALARLVDIINGRVIKGSYTGTGVGGSGNPNSLTFALTPKAVIITPRSMNCYIPIVIVWGQTIANGGYLQLYDEYSYGCPQRMSYSGNTVSWYYTGFFVDKSSPQYNQLNEVYDYVAIC